MEKITIKNLKSLDDLVIGEKEGIKTLVVQAPSYVDVSDGYHTMQELYDHRLTLWITLCRVCDGHAGMVADEWGDCTIPPEQKPWRSKLHHDGTGYDGWFILAIGREAGKQITYHIPMSRWDETDFAETFEKAPVPFDGHTSADVLERLKAL